MTAQDERAAVVAMIDALIADVLSGVSKGAEVTSGERVLGGLALAQFIKEAVLRGDHITPGGE